MECVLLKNTGLTVSKGARQNVFRPVGRYSVIPLFRRSAIPLFRPSPTIPLFRYSPIPLFRYSLIHT
jgi:hypothetical protein